MRGAARDAAYRLCWINVLAPALPEIELVRSFTARRSGPRRSKSPFMARNDPM